MLSTIVVKSLVRHSISSLLAIFFRCLKISNLLGGTIFNVWHLDCKGSIIRSIKLQVKIKRVVLENVSITLRKEACACIVKKSASSKITTLRGRSGSPSLYDLENNTFTFGSAPNNAVTIVLLDFIDTPQTFRQYVTLRSARIFQEEIIGQSSAEQINRIEESEAYADLLDDETDRAGYNVGYSDIEMYNITKKHRKVW